MKNWKWKICLSNKNFQVFVKIKKLFIEQQFLGFPKAQTFLRVNESLA